MERKNIWKKSISLLLIISLMFGVTGTGAWAQASNGLPAELAGYTKVTPESFGITEEVVHTYSNANIDQSYYVQNTTNFDKAYLDADIALTGTDVASGFGYLNPYLFRIYITGTTLAVYSLQASVLLYQTDLNTLEISEGEYFNLKFATDITESTNTDNTDVKVQMWVNNKMVTPVKDTVTVPDAYIGSWLNVTLTQAGTIKIRPHVEAPQDPLAGYQKIGAENFGITAEKVYTTSSGISTEYIEGVYDTNKLYFDKKYIEADVAITGEQGLNNSIQPIGNGIFMIYVSWGNFYVYSEKAGQVLYQAPISNLGNVGANGEYFHLKLATDVSDHATDTTKSNITLRIWVNDILVTPNALDTGVAKSNINAKTLTLTVADSDIANTLSVGMYGSEGTIKIKPHGEGTTDPEQPDTPEVPENPSEEYTKIGPETFGITEEKVFTADGKMWSGTPEGVKATETTYFNKKCFEAQIAMTGDQGLNNSIQPIGAGIFMTYISWGSFYVYSEKTASVLYEAPLSELGWDSANGGYVTVKFATDVVDNATDSAKSDITLKIWVNDNLVTSKAGTESVTITVDDTAITNSLNVGMYGSAGEVKIKPIIEQAEYITIGPETFGITKEKVFTADGTMWSGTPEGVEATDKTYFNKKYFEAQIAMTGDQGLNNSIQPIGTGIFMTYISWGSFYVYSEKTASVLYEAPLSELGWDSANGGYVTVKFATDVVDNATDSAKSDITLKIWVNDNLVTSKAGTESVTITVDDTAITNSLNVGMYGSAGEVKIKPIASQEPDNPDNPDNPEILDVKEVLKDYVRVIPDSFAIVDGNFKHGWTEGNWMGYEYPESLNHTYLDVDVSLCKDDTFNNAIRYASKNGWESLLIGIVGNNLQIFETTTNTLVYQVPLKDVGIEADKFFNMKLSTDISEDTLTLSLWINDTLVRPNNGEVFAVIEGCTALGNMLGVYLPYEGEIRIKTPQTGGGQEQKPDKTEQPNKNFTELTLGSFAVKDGKYGYVGTELAAKGTYIMSVNETVFSANFHFSKEAGADFRYGGKNNPWNGLRFWTTGDGKLYMQDATETTEIYAFHPLYAGVQLVDNTFNMKLSVEFVDRDKDGVKDDVKLGVWFDDVLYKNSYIYLANYAAQLGNSCSVYVMNEDAWVQITGDKTVYTGVDFTLFGFTTNWKKELGIK